VTTTNELTKKLRETISPAISGALRDGLDVFEVVCAISEELISVSNVSPETTGGYFDRIRLVRVANTMKAAL